MKLLILLAVLVLPVIKLLILNYKVIILEYLAYKTKVVSHCFTYYLILCLSNQFYESQWTKQENKQNKHKITELTEWTLDLWKWRYMWQLKENIILFSNSIVYYFLKHLMSHTIIFHCIHLFPIVSIVSFVQECPRIKAATEELSSRNLAMKINKVTFGDRFKSVCCLNLVFLYDQFL